MSDTGAITSKSQDATPPSGQERQGAQNMSGQPGSGGASSPSAEAERQTPAQGQPEAAPGRTPMNPYLAGFFLGITLLASYLILGTGLGASGAFARLGAWIEHAIAPARVEASAYFGPWFPDPLAYYLVFMAAGTFAGGLVSAVPGGRFRLMLERGPTAARLVRLLLALAGGVLAGFASRLAQGCTSGQGLSGGAMLLTGSFVFLGCLFLTGYLTAWMFRRQWK